jgi:phosphate/sulfate permease
METFYLILVIVLFVLAISDLVVGVSNDAVNFLNSAIGARVASFRVIMVIAAIGILFGATFSSGMMEVARKGIFHPQEFFFNEIIIIFLAVMITDVILLDLFNTFGLPTSTTVSIVFELLGAAVGMSIIKISRSTDTLLDLGTYINSDKALAIITGILLSIAVAFTAGVIIQYLSRLIFSFDYKKSLKKYGGIWGGIAISAITYFILIKGAKGASFMSDEVSTFIKTQGLLLIGGTFVFWTIVLQLITWFTNYDILKFIVLVGTFALAMAFAGNDLVNFIGVPIAGYDSYLLYLKDPSTIPETFRMTRLSQPIETPTSFLLIAGTVMVATLWLSKKARSVVKTSLDLGRQEEGYERFGSTLFSRVIVRGTIQMVQRLEVILPQGMKNKIDRRFDPQPFIDQQKKMGREAPAFDLIRASVTLVVASILISFATSLTLPLSTTYVTFMVAMGTSLADRAWGRESAVYRITGVISVIGGWFLTALAAFTVSLTFATIIYFGGIYAIILLILVAGFFVIRTQRIHRNRSAVQKEKEESIKIMAIPKSKIVDDCSSTTRQMIQRVANIYKASIAALENEDLKNLRKAHKDAEKLNSDSRNIKNSINSVIRKLEQDSIDTGQYYVQMIDHLRETVINLTFITKPCLDHIDNNHAGLIADQKEDLNKQVRMIADLCNKVSEIVRSNDYAKIQDVLADQKTILKHNNTFIPYLTIHWLLIMYQIGFLWMVQIIVPELINQALEQCGVWETQPAGILWMSLLRCKLI